MFQEALRYLELYKKHNISHREEIVSEKCLDLGERKSETQIIMFGRHKQQEYIPMLLESLNQKPQGLLLTNSYTRSSHFYKYLSIALIYFNDLKSKSIAN